MTIFAYKSADKRVWIMKIFVQTAIKCKQSLLNDLPNFIIVFFFFVLVNSFSTSPAQWVFAVQFIDQFSLYNPFTLTACSNWYFLIKWKNLLVFQSISVSNDAYSRILGKSTCCQNSVKKSEEMGKSGTGYATFNTYDEEKNRTFSLDAHHCMQDSFGLMAKSFQRKSMEHVLKICGFVFHKSQLFRIWSVW